VDRHTGRRDKAGFEQRIKKASQVVWCVAGLILVLFLLIYMVKGTQSWNCEFKTFKNKMNEKHYQLLVVDTTDQVKRLKVK